MGWHLCNDYDSCFQAIWQPCMEVHMTAGESPVAKRRQYRVYFNNEFRVSLDTDAKLRIVRHYLFGIFLKVIFITSHHYSYCQTTSSLSLAPKWGLTIPQTSVWTKVPELFKLTHSRWIAIDGRWPQKRSNVRWDAEERWHAEVKLV